MQNLRKDELSKTCGYKLNQEVNNDQLVNFLPCKSFPTLQKKKKKKKK